MNDNLTKHLSNLINIILVYFYYRNNELIIIERSNSDTFQVYRYEYDDSLIEYAIYDLAYKYGYVNLDYFYSIDINTLSLIKKEIQRRLIIKKMYYDIIKEIPYTKR